eukprot:scaffold990_cov393-Prasinococcus_capsulatus_cf.AAC.14
MSRFYTPVHASCLGGGGRPVMPAGGDRGGEGIRSWREERSISLRYALGVPALRGAAWRGAPVAGRPQCIGPCPRRAAPSDVALVAIA